MGNASEFLGVARSMFLFVLPMRVMSWSSSGRRIAVTFKNNEYTAPLRLGFFACFKSQKTQAGTKSTWLSWPYLAMQSDHTPSPEPQTLFEPFWLKARGFAHSCRILVVAASGHASARLDGQRRGLAERALHDPTVRFFDLQDEGPQEKRPKGEQAAAEHVTMDSIRTLLQELSVSILQAQRHNSRCP